MKKGFHQSRKKMLEPEKELIRIKRSGQITIPLQIRTHLTIRAGDYLEAVMTDKGLLLRPVRIVLKKFSLAPPPFTSPLNRDIL